MTLNNTNVMLLSSPVSSVLECQSWLISDPCLNAEPAQHAFRMEFDD
jgi:hypothetical protein